MIGSRPGSWICSPWELDALARRVGGRAGGCGSRIMIGAGNSDEACALLGLAEPAALSIPRAAAAPGRMV